MKRKFASFFFLLVAAVIAGAAFTSCGDDDDELNSAPVPGFPDKVAIGYSLELGDGWWDFFDIEVTYTAADGNLKTETVHKGWSYLGKADYLEAVTEYTFTATATPKADLPRIDETATYNFDKEANAYAYSLNYYEDQVGLLSSKTNSSTMSVAGTNMSRWLEVHSNLGAGTMTLKK